MIEPKHPGSTHPSHRLILRAEFLRGTDGEVVIAHTVELSCEGAFLQTHEPPELGEIILVRLSLPNVHRPLELDGRVVSRCEAIGPGEPHGVKVVWLVEDAERTDALRELVERLQR